MAQIKTAISLDRSLFEQVEILARKMKVSRSRLFAMALADFLQHRESEQLLQEINAAYHNGPDEAEQIRRQGMYSMQRKLVEGEW
jgi:metal-responsive CopG/Arc/MetJ family transcriptional regulator